MARRFQPKEFVEKALVVMVVITDGSRYVIVFNYDKRDRGWVWPGGHVLQGQDPEEVAVQSVLEETGLEVQARDLEQIRERQRESTEFISYRVVLTQSELTNVPRRGESGHEVKVVGMKELRRLVRPTRITMMEPETQSA